MGTTLDVSEAVRKALAARNQTGKDVQQILVCCAL